MSLISPTTRLTSKSPIFPIWASSKMPTFYAAFPQTPSVQAGWSFKPPSEWGVSSGNKNPDGDWSGITVSAPRISVISMKSAREASMSEGLLESCFCVVLWVNVLRRWKKIQNVVLWEENGIQGSELAYWSHGELENIVVTH